MLGGNTTSEQVPGDDGLLKQLTRRVADQALVALEDSAQRRDAEHSHISPSWRAHWQRLSVFFDYPATIGKAIYTTSAIEPLNPSLRKVTRTRRSSPDDVSAIKRLYLTLNAITHKCTMSIGHWKQAISQFMILYTDRHYPVTNSQLHKKFYGRLKR